MSISSAFEAFQTAVNAEREQVKTARERRDLFKGAFGGEADVLEVVPSGSLARGTQKDPIHDVDTIIVYDGSAHPAWGTPGKSAEEALNYTQSKVGELLGGSGTYDAGQVRYTRWRNHAVKCWLDPKDDPDAFTVDAMPALRSDKCLLVPEAATSRWIECDPEYLIAQVAAKHAAWRKFAGSVRMLKYWASIQEGCEIKSLVMEVLALDLMPSGNLQPVALKEFFVRAAEYIGCGWKVEDPARYCGEIQTSLDYGTFGELLRDAANDSGSAITAQNHNNDFKALDLWKKIFGPAFPDVPKPPAVVPPTGPRTVKDNPQGY